MTMTEAPAATTLPPVERRVGIVGDVRAAERIVEVVAVPYNEETVVEYHGQMVTESVLPGAFDGIETLLTDPKARPIPVNRDHDRGATIGKVVGLYPSREVGLVTEVRISPTLRGDEALILAADGVLGASIGMRVYPKDQRWSDNRSRRQIVRAFMDHLALLENPAYAGAGVLSVRSDTAGEPLYVPPPTPNLDRVNAYLRDLNRG